MSLTAKGPQWQQFLLEGPVLIALVGARSGKYTYEYCMGLRSTAKNIARCDVTVARG